LSGLGGLCGHEQRAWGRAEVQSHAHLVVALEATGSADGWGTDQAGGLAAHGHTELLTRRQPHCTT
jgi:hypothetical protein